MPTLPTLACKDCGHVNEGERVYCHNCGNKLDRSIILAQHQEQAESLEEKQRRVKKMMNPTAGLGRGFLKVGLKAVLWGAALAALVNMALPPREMPPMPKEKFVDAPQLGMILEDISMAPPGRRIRFLEKDINGYLQNTVRMKKGKGALADLTEFQRLFVKVEEGSIQITSQNAVYKYPLYAGLIYGLKVEENKLVATPLGGHIGRLSIHPLLTKYAGLAFQPIWVALKREEKLMNQIGSVELLKDEMILGSRSAPAPAVQSPPAAGQ